MARAALAAGADGLLIEVHSDPDKALSDGAQSSSPRSSSNDERAANHRTRGRQKSVAWKTPFRNRHFGA